MAQPRQYSRRATLSRYTLPHYVSQDLVGCRRSTLEPLKGPCSTYLFSSERGCRTLSCHLWGVAVQGGVATTLSPAVLQWVKFPEMYTIPRGPCDRKNSIPIENFNPGLNFQSRSNISISIDNFNPGVSICGALLCTEKGLIENFNPRSIARNFQSRRPRSIFFNPRPSGLFSKSLQAYLGDCSYSFKGSFELIGITVTVSWGFLAGCSCRK